VQKYRKAIAAALLGGVAAAVGVLSTGADYKAIIVAFVAGALGVGGGVAASPANKPKTT
jgi:hypothetical protein